jgi:hypothetical protein
MRCGSSILEDRSAIAVYVNSRLVGNVCSDCATPEEKADAQQSAQEGYSHGQDATDSRILTIDEFDELDVDVAAPDGTFAPSAAAFVQAIRDAGFGWVLLLGLLLADSNVVCAALPWATDPDETERRVHSEIGNTRPFLEVEDGEFPVLINPATDSATFVFIVISGADWMGMRAVITTGQRLVEKLREVFNRNVVGRVDDA